MSRIVPNAQPADLGVPVASSDAAKSRMERQRRKDTKPEVALRSELHRRGLRYGLHKPIVPDSTRTVDIVFPSARLCVDVRGCWWHGCSEHFTVPKTNREWWERKIDTNRRRDRDTEERLTAAGWTVVVAWSHDDPVEVADHVEQLIRPASPITEA